jgi:hypothetical protein
MDAVGVGAGSVFPHSADGGVDGCIRIVVSGHGSEYFHCIRAWQRSRGWIAGGVAVIAIAWFLPILGENPQRNLSPPGWFKRIFRLISHARSRCRRHSAPPVERQKSAEQNLFHWVKSTGGPSIVCPSGSVRR